MRHDFVLRCDSGWNRDKIGLTWIGYWLEFRIFPTLVIESGSLQFQTVSSRNNPEMSDTDTHDQVVTKTRKKLKPPTGYKVLLHNDNYTTMEFVVYVLESIFNKSPSDAMRIMLHVHKNGIGVCGVFTHEVAETKVAAVHDLASQYEYPLKASMEEA